MPFNSGKIGVLNQPSTTTAEGYYSIQQQHLFAGVAETVGYGISGSGGTVTDVTVGGTTYRVHTFTSSSNFVVSTGVTVE